MTLESLGAFLAVGGSATSIIGTLYNNLYLNHHKAMLCWMLSNPILLVWAIGYGISWWNGGLSAWALAGMYLIFAVTNLYGLRKKELA